MQLLELGNLSIGFLFMPTQPSKILLQTFQCSRGSGPTYLKDLLTPNTPTRNSEILVIPKSQFIVGRAMKLLTRDPKKHSL